VDEATELRRGVLLLARERRAGEADVAGVLEHPAHHAVQMTVLRAVALIDQHKDVRIVVLDVLLGHRLELVHGRGDNVGALRVDELDQMPTRVGLLDRLAARLEGAVDLLVEVNAVGDEHDARVGDGGVQRERLGQHHHRQRLAAAGRVPDDAAGALPLRVEMRHAVERRLDGEVLLVAGDLLHPAVEDDEPVDKLQQALWVKQAVERAVLLGGQALADALEVPPHPVAIVAPVVQARGLLLAERLVDQLVGRRLVRLCILLLPHRPELGRRVRCGILRDVLVNREQKLRVHKQVRDILRLLVADHLRDAFLDAVLVAGVLVRALALDDDERNAVHKQHDVRAAGLIAAGPLDGELLRDVIDVVLRVLPVDVVQTVVFGVAVHGLRQADAERQQLVHGLVGLHQPLIKLDGGQPADRGVDVALAEGDQLPAPLDGVVLTQPGREDAGEHDVALPTAAQRQRLGGREILPAKLHEHLQRGDLRDE